MEANTMISYITGSFAAIGILAFCAYAGESVIWYFICASVLAAFTVYLVATGGWERLRDIWERTKYKDGES